MKAIDCYSRYERYDDDAAIYYALLILRRAGAAIADSAGYARPRRALMMLRRISRHVKAVTTAASVSARLLRATLLL